MEWPSDVLDHMADLGNRFEDAIALRVERRANTLNVPIDRASIDQAIRGWLGAAAEEILKD